MLGLCLLLIPVAFALALPATLLARTLGRRLSAMDGGGVAGQTKAAPRRVPNIGGIGIFTGVALPLLAALLLIKLGALESIVDAFPQVRQHVPGLLQQSGKGLVLLVGIAALHVLGLIDDRRPLRAMPKLLIMLVIAAAAVVFTDTRLLTVIDIPAGGTWLSIALTVLWIVAITNAFNFLDNMDGLAAGVATICASVFLTVCIMSPQPQWFVAAVLAMLVGSLLGFLVWNFPFRPRVRLASGGTEGGASIFMGDGGSLVVGFALAFMSVRVTYTPMIPGGPGAPDAAGAPAASSAWFAAAMPLVILAIPLYDFCSVCILRIRQGRSPFVGDLQHFSHRLVRHGLSPRAAVLVIYGCTAVTGIGAISLPRLETWQAALVGVQTLLVLGVIALYEWRRDAAASAGREP